MNLQGVHPRTSANGYAHRRGDKEAGARTESKMQPGKSTFSNFGSAGLPNDGRVGVGSPSCDRLIYIMTNLVGHRVEVHVKNGSIISGIFHTTNVEKDFGIVLKMAQVIKDSVRGQKPVPDTPHTFIIPARELVQVLAKDVSLSMDEFTNENSHERRKDLLIDSAISHYQHIDMERELERWTPDKDDPGCPELENVFDETWNRNWDQFETNEVLFGVKSTFDEELYTTKLERGPQMREIEREALRIAREIEGEETHDHHQAEERGMVSHQGFDHDEESIYSAVHREVDDGRFEENENIISDACSSETFRGSLSFVLPRSNSNVSRGEFMDGAQSTSTCLSVVKEESSRLTSDSILKSLPVGDDSRLDEKQIDDQDDEKSFRNASEEPQTSKSDGIEPAMNLKGLSLSATTYDPSSSGEINRPSISKSTESVSGKSSAANEPLNPSLRDGSSTSSTSEHVATALSSSGLGLSPSSSVGSLSSDKSTLNPNAKEFKFNPHAESFTPSTSIRPHAPIAEGAFYYSNNISAVSRMNNLPVGIGFGPSFAGHQPVYNPQGAQVQSPQAFIPPNGPMFGPSFAGYQTVYGPQGAQVPSPQTFIPSNGPTYGQHMIPGQPRPVFYMPTYQPDPSYRGRNP